MIGYKLTWLLLAVLLGGICATAGSLPVLALFLLVVALPVVSLPGDLLAAKRLRVYLQCPVNLRKGQVGQVTLAVENRFWLPACRVACRVTLENGLTGERRQMTVQTGCMPRKTAFLALDCAGDYAGRVHVTVDRVRVYDCFGLLPMPGPARAKTAVTVQPDTFVQKILITTDHGCPDDSEVYSPYRPGGDLTETFQIREYREGDHPRQLHWKLSAKLEKLIVREPSLPITRSVVVFWERTGQQAETAELADLQAELVVSACKALVEQSIAFTVVWNDTVSDRCIMQEIRDMDELVGLLPRLLDARGRVGGVTGAEAFVHAVGEGVFSHILYLAAAPGGQAGLLARFGALTQLYCSGTPTEGERAIVVDRARYPQQLLELEI